MTFSLIRGRSVRRTPEAQVNKGTAFDKRERRPGAGAGTDHSLRSSLRLFRGLEIVDGADVLDDLGGGADLGDDLIHGLIGHGRLVQGLLHD